MERRTRIELAHGMRHLVGLYPEAESIRVVLDNLNTARGPTGHCGIIDFSGSSRYCSRFAPF
jgi:hypothetical protein